MKINIDVTIDVYALDAPQDTAVSEVMHLELPRLASKYIQFPKIFEGVIEQIVERHNNRVTAWEVQRAKEEAERRARPRLWDDYRADAPDGAVTEYQALAAEGEAPGLLAPEHATPETAAEVFPDHGVAYPVIDGQLLLNATDEEIAAAVEVAAAEVALACGLLTEDHDGE